MKILSCRHSCCEAHVCLLLTGLSHCGSLNALSQFHFSQSHREINCPCPDRWQATQQKASAMKMQNKCIMTQFITLPRVDFVYWSRPVFVLTEYCHTKYRRCLCWKFGFMLGCLCSPEAWKKNSQYWQSRLSSLNPYMECAVDGIRNTLH